MELLRQTHWALEATRRLDTALAEGDLVRCAALVAEREAVLAAFAELHRKAGDREREACRETIAELLAADEDLRRRAEEEMTAAAAALDDAPRSKAEPRQPVTSGLDRRA